MNTAFTLIHRLVRRTMTYLLACIALAVLTAGVIVVGPLVVILTLHKSTKKSDSDLRFFTKLRDTIQDALGTGDEKWKRDHDKLYGRDSRKDRKED